MLRNNIKNITNMLAAEDGSLQFDLFRAYNAILNYCIKTGTLHTPRKNVYEVINGALYINNVFVERVAPLPARVAEDDAALYYEGRILARQEAYYENY